MIPKPNRLGRAAAPLLLAAVLTGAATACDGPPTARPHPGAGHATAGAADMPLPARVPVTSVGASPTAWQLPMDAYQYTPAQSAELQAAVYSLANSCMRELGYSTDLPTRLRPGPDHNAFRYGPVTEAQAAQGYRWMLRKAAPDGAGALNPTGEEYGALLGTSRHGRNGRPVPTGGCFGSARGALADGGGRVDLPDVIRAIADDSYALSRRTAQVQAVFHAWSACMRQAGYHYPDPTAPARDKALVGTAPSGTGPVPAPGPREVAVARADVACKRQVGLLSVWYSVERTLQTEAAARHAAELAAVPAVIARTVRNATAVLNGGGHHG
ncbi:hypothetical protein [Streptomyces sp. LaBMicrA B280]|uniref:hypothetical protein n=1 Tax=Streptomyces sp. LaBMicrA B280 TaxID=3391001 RepID=UPI003BA50318